MGETNPQALTQGAAGPSPHALRARAKKPIVFGKYELLARFRVGGMAEVWTAKRLGSGGDPALVAIKRILPSFTDEADYIAMFRDEARLAQQLAHPNIVATLEVGQVDDHPYIALEHVRGQNVAALIRKAREQSEPVPASMALRIAIDVCRALEHAHNLADAAGRPLEIVHRDVSPTNILLGYDGEVKLIDFGIAKSNEQLMRTQAGLLKGKHGYLSPEQAAGEPVDARSDLFSLAICVWEMLAAKRLFLGASDFSSIAKVRQAVVPPLAEAGAPSAVEHVLQRALARDRTERYASATELREAFEQAGGETVAIATPAELATYLNEVFADEIALAASEEALDAPAPYEGTGLLDAFDDLEPVSTVSTLAVIPDVPDEPAASAEEEEIDEDLDLTEVAAESAPAGEAFELMREPDADAESDAATAAPADDTTAMEPVAALDAGEPDTQEVPELAGSAAAAMDEANAEPAEAQTPVALASPASNLRGSEEDEQPDEPTRVVAYRSLESGEVGSPAAEAVGAAAATLPGMGGVEWDDEELSTHLYDGPSAAALEQEAPAADVGDHEIAGAEEPAGTGVVRPSIAPFSAKAGTPQFVLRPSGAPAPAVASEAVAPLPAAPRAPAKGTPAWLLPALIAATAIVVFFALSLFRAATPGTIHLATQPPDARVLFDGKPVDTTISPFVIAAVPAGEQHRLEVSRDGYRTWQTTLRVGDGQTLQLPEVVLVPVEPSAPVAAAAPAPQPEIPQPEPAKVEAPKPEAPKAVAPKPDAPKAEASKTDTAKAPIKPRARAAGAASSPAAPAIAARPAQPVAGTDTGMLRINSRPWAQIHVDGRLIGNTPQMALRLSPGNHTVLLVNPELKLRKTFTVQIKRGAVTTKIVELMK